MRSPQAGQATAAEAWERRTEEPEGGATYDTRWPVQSVLISQYAVGAESESVRLYQLKFAPKK